MHYIKGCRAAFAENESHLFKAFRNTLQGHSRSLVSCAALHSLSHHQLAWPTFAFVLLEKTFWGRWERGLLPQSPCNRDRNQLFFLRAYELRERAGQWPKQSYIITTLNILVFTLHCRDYKSFCLCKKAAHRQMQSSLQKDGNGWLAWN